MMKTPESLVTKNVMQGVPSTNWEQASNIVNHFFSHHFLTFSEETFQPLFLINRNSLKFLTCGIASTPCFQ